MRAALLAALLLLPATARAVKVETLRGVLAGGRDLEVAAESAFVQFSSGTTLAAKQTALAGTGMTLAKDYPSLNWTFVTLPSGMSVVTGLNLLRALPGVVAAQPDLVYRPSFTPNDPSVFSQYALSQVNAFAAWEYEKGEDGIVTVAVIDAGVDQTHPELAAKMAGLAHEFCDPTTGVCAADNAGAGGIPLTACNHGTRVAGVAAAAGNNGAGVAGIAFGTKVKILSVRVFRDTDCTASCGNNGLNQCVTDDNGLIGAFNYVSGLVGNALYGRIVANVSIGGTAACAGAVSTALNNAVNKNAVNGIPFAFAAGNSGGTVETPANCAGSTGGSGIIPVGATDSQNSVPSFSSRGAELSTNGLVAPGKDVLTTDLNGAYANATGTSFSSPHVAGLAALMLSKKPTMTPVEVQNALRGGADQIGVSGFGVQDATPLGNVSGAGRMDAFRSMRLAVNGTLADFDGDQKAIAFPNPFRLSQSQTVTFTIPTALQGAQSTIQVFTVDGGLVRTLYGQTWDGKNTNGALVASGTYIFLVSTDKGTTKGRVAVIR